MNRNPSDLTDEDLKKLPKADWTDPQITCPECGWYGNNDEDVTATFHEMIQYCSTEEGTDYYHCTACGTDFVDGKKVNHGKGTARSNV